MTDIDWIDRDSDTEFYWGTETMPKPTLELLKEQDKMEVNKAEYLATLNMNAQMKHELEEANKMIARLQLELNPTVTKDAK